MIDYLHNEFYFNKDGFHIFNFFYESYIFSSPYRDFLIHMNTRTSGKNWSLLRNITKEEDHGATEFQIAICKL